MSQILFKAMPGQVDVDEAKGIVECFVAGIGNKDSVGDIVLPGAFTESLKRRKPRVVWGHDWNHPIGKVLEIYEVPRTDPRLPKKMKDAGIGGLFARVQFNLKSEKGREAFANVAFYGMDQEWSIGYKTLEATYDNERKANLLREVELYEVSPVLHGANQLTGTISIKSEQQNRVTSFKKSKWPMFDREFAARIKEEYPEIWNAGGNIKGNDQYEILTRIAEQGGVAKTDDQISALELREAWVARHEGDFRLPGVVAQMKWLAIGSRGEDHMKNVVNEAISKMKSKKDGGIQMTFSDLADAVEEILEDVESKGGYGKPNRRKLQALMDAVLKMAEDDEDDESMDVDMEGDLEEKEPMWRLRRLLGLPMEPEMARPVWDDDDDDDDDDDEMRMPMRMRMRKPGGCNCGCGGMKDDEKSFDDDIDVKAGRVLSTSNMQKLMKAIELLREVMAAGGRQDIEMKEPDVLIKADVEELFHVKSYIDPVLDYWNAEAEVSQEGITVKSCHPSLIDALDTALSGFHDASPASDIEFYMMGDN